MTNATSTIKQGIPSTFGEGGSGLTPGGSSGRPDLKELLWFLADRLHAPVAARTDLDAIGATGTNPVSSLYTGPASTLDRADGMICLVEADNSFWRFAAADTNAADATSDLRRMPADNPTAGRWNRVDTLVELLLPFTFANADASVLWTVPAGFRPTIAPSSFWEITAPFTGGASSAIGLSSSNAGCSTKGDLLGGAAGDVAATLVATGALAKGTVGAKTGKPAATLVAGDTIRFDRITSAFTAGTGVAHIHLLLP